MLNQTSWLLIWNHLSQKGKYLSQLKFHVPAATRSRGICARSHHARTCKQGTTYKPRCMSLIAAPQASSRCSVPFFHSMIVKNVNNCFVLLEFQYSLFYGSNSLLYPIKFRYTITMVLQYKFNCRIIIYCLLLNIAIIPINNCLSFILFLHFCFSQRFIIYISPSIVCYL